MQILDSERSPRQTEGSLLDKRIDFSRVDWEIVAFGLLLVVTVATRFIDLGSRPLHHDEAQHAFFSWNLFRGAGYQYDPMLHGPFLYNLTALLYFLFGVGDATARLGPAIFGVLLVGGCYFLRPYLGRAGALSAAAVLTLSPVSLYYSRFIRHDIFAATATLGMAIAVLGFVRSRRPAYLYLGAVSLAISWSSHELTFITMFIFGSFLVLVALTGGRAQNLVLSAFSGLRQSPQVVLATGAIFVAIFALLFTNYLTYPAGFADGLYKSLAYWLGQHGVARGGQPWYYYLLLLSVYEPLGLVVGLLGGMYLFLRGKRKSGSAGWFGEEPGQRWMRSFTLFFLIYWFVMATAIYSWAGEKMPWLALHLVLPLSLLAGVSIDSLVSNLEWEKIRREKGYLFAAVCIVFLAIIGGLIALFAEVTPGSTLVLQVSILALIAAVVLYGVVVYGRKLGFRAGKQVLALTLIAILGLYMVHSAWNVAYYNGATPVEMLVYVQTTPATKNVADRIHVLSRDITALDRSSTDVTGGKSLKVLVDRSVEWPFDWYLRDLSNHNYFTVDSPPTTVDADVVLVAAEHEQNIGPLLAGDYVSERYPLRWWFPEENYRSLTPSTVLSNLTSMDSLGKLARYYLYRDLSEPLGSYDFLLYVKKDLAPRLGIPVTGQAASSDTVSGQ